MGLCVRVVQMLPLFRVKGLQKRAKDLENGSSACGKGEARALGKAYTRVQAFMSGFRLFS